MTDDDGRPPDVSDAFAELRARAEELQSERPRAEELTPEAAGRLIHELQTHQIELQLQNAALLRVQSELAESHARYVDLYDRAPVGYLTVDVSGVIVEANETVAEMLCHPRDELIGDKLSDHVGSEHQDVFFITLRAMARAEERRQEELELRRRDGGLFWARTDWTHVPGREGAEPSVRVAASDQTDFKSLQAQLMQADRLSSMGLLAAGIAHEINNPLTFVLLNLDALCEQLPRIAAGGDELHDVVDLARTAAEGARRIQDLARRFKVFSRPDPSSTGPVKLARVLDSATEMVRPELRSRARLVTRYDDTPDVVGNAGELCQVFLNLLINAAHAIPEGNVGDNEVRVTAIEDGDAVIVTVADTGSGIEPDHVGRIFEPFYTTKAVGAGSGLGLAMCQKILAALGGTIGVQSKPGVGTAFEVRLLVHAPSPRDALHESAPALEERPVSRRGRILVVDDEPQIAAAIARILDGHEVVVVHSGLEARDLIARGDVFDVILCDLMMPEFSGIDLYEWIEAEHPNLLERMVLMTGAAFTPQAQDLLASALNQALNKPFLREEVEAAVQQVIAAPKR